MEAAEAIADARKTAGALIINADDWGRDASTTDAIFRCVRRGTVSSASAMVFMADSERAAVIAREHNVEVGLHMNLTTDFSAPGVPQRLVEQHRRISSYLRNNSVARVFYNPWLSRSFEYVVKAQIEEFTRMFGTLPTRIDGHHHAHLCSNVLVGGLLPRGVSVRRYFSYEQGQDVRNRLFRSLTDRLLAKRYRMTDFFFSLPPISSPDRLSRIFSLASTHVVEVETHPINPEECDFLMGEEILHWTKLCPIVQGYVGKCFQQGKVQLSAIPKPGTGTKS